MNTYTQPSNLLDQRHTSFASLIHPANYTTAYHPNSLGHLFHHLAEQTVNWLTAGAMPRISRTTKNGAEVWRVYDPTSNQTLYFAQENALRVWMEERYNH
ncbi:MAG: hypothetical protein AAGH67_01045 [Cyanobacteria bacterium P01_H01_bin.162]